MTALNHAGNEYAARLAAQARTPKEFLVDAKVYYHHNNGARFHFDLGGSRVKSVMFVNFRYITDDKREQDQLDLVADVPGSFIYTITDSDVAAALQRELQQELAQDVMKTAAASAAVANQMFDPNTPILPVTVTHQQPTQVQVRPVQPQAPQVQNGGAVVGLSNSFSGQQAVETPTAPVPVTAAVAPNAASEALARLQAMTSSAQAPQE